MWIQKKFKNCKKYERNGVIAVVKMPKCTDFNNRNFNLKISKKSKEINIVDGTNSIVITDEIGIGNKVHFSLLFIKEAMVVIINKGNLYVRDENGKIFIINNKGIICDYTGDCSDIIWKNREYFIDSLGIIVGSKYNLVKRVEKLQYINNLIFSLSAYFKFYNNSLFGLSVLNMNTAIGLNEFKFIVKEGKISKNKLENDSKFNLATSSDNENESYNDNDEIMDEIDFINSVSYYDNKNNEHEDF